MVCTGLGDLVFYVLLSLGADFDFLAVTIIMISILLMFVDRRFPLGGWFLRSTIFLSIRQGRLIKPRFEHLAQPLRPFYVYFDRHYCFLRKT